MDSRGFLLLALIAVCECVTVKDFYPYGGKRSARLNHGDSRRSTQISLAVPTKFYNKEYDYLWVHVDGFISFQPDASDAPEQDFPFQEALLAPYMADLDTTNRGEVYYRERHDKHTLKRATRDVRRAFDDATDFVAESVFVVTWKDVEGSSLYGEPATFTFQSVLVSNGRDTYAIFLYPEQNMGVMLDGSSSSDTSFRARAGFNDGPSNYLDMFPVESLVNFRNTDRDGEWIFQVGGEGVRRNNDVIAPRVAKHRKRQAINNLINVQDVTLTEEGEDDASVLTVPSRANDYCSRVEDPCTDPNSRCVNLPSGYCCKCFGDYFGNGSFCLGKDNPVRTNGNVSGTVDVVSSDGSVERVNVQGRFHSYVIPNQGRAYTAMSGVTPVLGRALQPMSVIGEIVGWLFADTGPGAVNGFHYTGGNFQRRVSVRFSDKHYRFDMRQKFKGVTIDDDVPIVLGSTDLVGRLPGIEEGSKVTMGDLVETYTKTGPGQIESRAQRTYLVNDTTYTYNVTQTIIFGECRDASRHVPNKLGLNVFGIFLSYHDYDDNVRYAMNNRITVAAGAAIPSPCVSNTHDCGANAVCVPQDGANYDCRCVSGYQGDGRTCEAVSACLTAYCPPNSVCVDTAPGQHRCDCAPGYERDNVGDCVVPTTPAVTEPPTPADPCSSAPCGAGLCASSGSAYSCNCNSGHYFDGTTCLDLDECVENRHNCDVNAACVNYPGSFECTCNSGFQGDGVTCVVIGADAQEMTECRRQYIEVEELINNNPGLQDGPEYPICVGPDDNFAPRQCNGFTQVCWCVETVYGATIEGTETEPGRGYDLDCSDPSKLRDPTTEPPTTAPPSPTPPSGLTQCQLDRWEADQNRARDPSLTDIYQPLCTLAGAYEPLQFHDGWFLCIDFNGVEVSRHREQPDCLTVCQLTAYYADTDNTFLGTNNFVPQCTSDGSYAQVQCDVDSRSCYCVDQNGIEVPNTRTQTDNQEIARANLDCDRLSRPPADYAAQLIFAQAMGYNSVLLPVTSSSVAERIYSRAGQTVVGVAFDCAKQTVYWTDVSGRSIYSAPLSDPDSRRTVVKRGIRAPEGVAVDYVSGNIYWTDTGMNQIMVARADGSNKMAIVRSGISDPRGIAVDPFGAKIYWTDWDRSNPRIMRANTDGTEPEVFLSGSVNLPNDLTIDQFNRRLCYLDAGTGRQRVECMDLDGSNRRVVVDINRHQSGIRPFGLDVDGGMVYFSDRSGQLYAVDSRTDEWTSTSGPVGAHGKMFGVAIAFTQCAGGVNGCSRLYGGCSHLCLPVAGGRVCKCPSGAQDCTEQ